MKAEGYLDATNHSSLNIESFKSNETKNVCRSKFELSKKEIRKRLHTFEKVENLDDSYFSTPELTIFQAEKGDSVILIDGGDVQNPCFWEKIKALPKIDCAIITHGDTDHTKGFIPFIQGTKLVDVHVPKIDKFVMVWSDEKTDLLENIYRNYHHVSKIGEYINKQSTIKFNSSMKPDNFKIGNITVQLLLPNKAYLEAKKDLTIKIQKKIKDAFPDVSLELSARNITNINIFGITVLIECNNNQYLFTADCHSRDIVGALEKISQKNFFCVDAPHHGSDKNEFNYFYNYLSDNNYTVEHFVISSLDESRPGKNFLKILKNDRKIDGKKPIFKNIHFNYSNGQQKNLKVKLLPSSNKHLRRKLMKKLIK
eukprot:gene10235-2655_t